MEEYFSRKQYQSGPYTMIIRKGFGEPQITFVSIRSEGPDLIELSYKGESVEMRLPQAVTAAQAATLQQKIDIAVRAANEFNEILQDIGELK